MAGNKARFDEDGTVWFSLGKIESDETGFFGVLTLGGDFKTRAYPSREEAEAAISGFIVTSLMEAGF